eukprot:761961-Hanusia_phi.AAC.2
MSGRFNSDEHAGLLQRCERTFGIQADNHVSLCNNRFFRTSDGEYLKPEDFEADVRKIIANAVALHRESDEVEREGHESLQLNICSPAR